MNVILILSKVSVEVLFQQGATCTTLKHEATQCCTAALYKTHMKWVKPEKHGELVIVMENHTV